MNFKNLKITLLFFVATLIISCSSDDESSGNQNEIFGSLTFNGQSYDLKSAAIFDENIENDDPSDIGFNFSNTSDEEVNSGNDLSNIARIYFDFTEINLQETTYTDILDYDVSLNGTYIDENYTEGELVLSDNDPTANIYATSATVTIINITDTTVNITFSFTRNDEQVITGSYNGPYTIPVF